MIPLCPFKSAWHAQDASMYACNDRSVAWQVRPRLIVLSGYPGTLYNRFISASLLSALCRYFWIKEQLDKGLLRLVYLDTDSMPADFFASPRTGSSIRHFRSIIMGEIIINIQCIITFKECVKKCSYRYLYSLVRTHKFCLLYTSDAADE